jgi:carboxyl-terminal processing protease
VLLTVVRMGWDTPRDVRTVRDRIKLELVRVEAFGTGMGYARLVQFHDNAAKDLHAKVRGLYGGEAPRGLILDLRDNPGGLLDEAVAVADLFLDEGPIVETRSRTEGHTVHEATAGGFPAEMPIVVLVNGQSASAAEIVAAALQDTKRARLVGTRTYGKGSVQTIYENRDESALKLTIGRYFTPSGQPVAPREGRQPEYVVTLPGGPDPADQLRQRLTEAVGDEAARAELLGLLDGVSPPHAREEGAVSWTGTVAERVDRDPQLRTAVDLIEGRTP